MMEIKNLTSKQLLKALKRTLNDAGGYPSMSFVHVTLPGHTYSISIPWNDYVYSLLETIDLGNPTTFSLQLLQVNSPEGIVRVRVEKEN